MKMNTTMAAAALAATALPRYGQKSAGATPPAATTAPKGEPPQAIDKATLKSLMLECVKEGIDSALPDQMKNLVTMDGLEKLIDQKLKAAGGDSKTIALADAKTLVADFQVSVNSHLTAQMENIRRNPKPFKNPGDAIGDPNGATLGNLEGKSQVEYGDTSWRKGNLPLHGKQLMNILLNRPENEGIDAKQLERGKNLGNNRLDSLQRKAAELDQMNGKAMTSTGAATGDEFVPTDLSSELQRRFYLESALAALMLSREINMPTNPYQYPLSTTRPSFYLESTENTDATGSTPGTGALTLTASSFKGMVEASYEVEEDSIIPILPFIQQQLAEAAAAAWEHALINGDSTATHMDTDEELLTKSPAFAFKGFRKLAHAVSALKTDISSGGINEANLRALRKLMGKYALDPRKLVLLCSPKGALDAQAIANVSTMDKFGTRATIITGELAAIFGIPIIGSESVREDVDATGINGASGNTKSTIQIVRLDRFLVGSRRGFTVEVDRNIKSSTHQIVASFRRAFTPIEVPSASVPSVVLGYNITP